MIKILETQLSVPHPLALQLNYAALDFNFTSWMSPQNLRVLQSEQSSGNLSGLIEQKDHFKHVLSTAIVISSADVIGMKRNEVKNLIQNAYGEAEPKLQREIYEEVWKCECVRLAIISRCVGRS